MIFLNYRKHVLPFVPTKISQLPITIFVNFGRRIKELEFDGEVSSFNLNIAPVFENDFVEKRRLCFSLDQRPQLDFSYFLAGITEIDGETVFLFLEEVK